jgi:hypothetical protein
MGAILNENVSNLIEMRELQDGQIGIIVGSGYDGRIVQRYKDYGVTIGRHSGCGWTGIDNVTLLVRVLSTGELIEVFDNDGK